jgi:DNA-binding NtrC family response regulator
MRHEFTGNARELENLIEYAFVMCHDGLIQPGHLPEDFQAAVAARPAGAEQATPERTPLDRAEAETIEAALVRTGGHLSRAAEYLGLSRTTLWRKMKQYRIEPKKFRRRRQPN